jgi:hypothetical protein
MARLAYQIAIVFRDGFLRVVPVSRVGVGQAYRTHNRKLHKTVNFAHFAALFCLAQIGAISAPVTIFTSGQNTAQPTGHSQ